MLDLESKVQQVTQPRLSLHVPILQPDEFFMGYLGRMTVINGLSSTSDTSRILSDWFNEGKTTTKVVPIVYSLAKALQMEAKSLIQRHTLLPIARTIKRNPKKAELSTEIHESDMKGIRCLTGKKFKKAACICEECTKEDINYLGFSFWRRSHQLSGIDWCTKHNTALLEVNEKDVYAKQPLYYLSNNQYNTINTESYAQNPAVLRYVQLIQDITELATPLDFKKVAQVLLIQSKTFNISSTAKGRKNSLSGLIIDSLPSSWLSRHFNIVSNQLNESYISSLNDVIRFNSQGKSCTNTILAAAVLFENADEALYRLTHHEYKPIKSPIKTAITDETLIKSYIKNKGNIVNVSNELNTKYKSILLKCSKNGLPALTKVNQITFNEIKSFYEGKDFASILNTPGININLFSSVIRTAGVRFSNTINKLNKFAS